MKNATNKTTIWKCKILCVCERERGERDSNKAIRSIQVSRTLPKNMMEAKKRLLIFTLGSSLLLISLPSHSSILNYDLWMTANFPRWEIQRILWKVRWLNKGGNGQSEGIHSTHTLFMIYMSGCISFNKDRGQQQLAPKSSCEKALQNSKKWDPLVREPAQEAYRHLCRSG